MKRTIALVGNPNSGKTSIFNELTGSTQYVGNWPGVTIEKKEGTLRKNKHIKLVDLPGVYSLSPYSPEEIVTRDYLVSKEVDLIVNIVDGTNLERNLYLTSQLMETGTPVIIALNMIDAVKRSGASIDSDKLSLLLGMPVIETSAVKGTGLENLVNTIADEHVTASKQFEYSPEVESALSGITALLPDAIAQHARRWHAIKLFERDQNVLIRMQLSDEVKNKIEHIIATTEASLDDTSEGIITNDRYFAISNIVSQCSIQAKIQGKLTSSDKIDKVVTNRWIAIPIFFVVMWGIYYIAIQGIGELTIGWMEWLFADFIGANIRLLLESARTSAWLTNLVVEGLIGGVGSVLSFVPQMMILFFFLSLMEDSGYMARVAFIMDRVFRKFGLSGKSFIPMLIGTGCSVPAIMASRTIENLRDRRMTVMLVPFIPCGAKLPVFALLTASFFSGSAWVASSMYLIGIIMVIISGIVLKRTKAFAGESAPFVMELPSYHMPRIKQVAIHMWERSKMFIKKAGTIIALASVLIWIAQSIDWTFASADPSQSILASVGKILAPLFVPLGFGTWQATVAIITGLMAKETVVSTLQIVLGTNGADIIGLHDVFSPLSAYAFMIFILLAAPCIAAIGATYNEMKSKRWTFAAVLFQTSVAYIMALFVFQFGSLLIR
jgi:ferrous iron transport protein B